MKVLDVKIVIAILVVYASSMGAMMEPKTPHKGNDHVEERQETGNKSASNP